MRVREDEQGFSIFVLDGVWYVYRSCYFGCRWAAYWFSRVGSWLVRLLHRFIWIAHGPFLCSDDGLEFLPTSVGPLLAVATLMLLGAVGVPISWKKVCMGHELVWIGWRFNAVAGAAFLPYEKASKIVKGLRKLCDKSVEIDRHELEKVIGLLVWFCDGAFWLRPWLSCFYKILYKPRVVTRRILACQFLDVISSLTDEVRTSCKFSDCDVGKGWKLHSVNNVEIKGLSCRALQMPRVKRGCVSAVFFDYNAQKTKTSSDSAHAARLFCNAVESSVSIPLCIRYANDGVAAADAFADSDVAGVGGWWLPQTGGSIAAGDAFWFSVVLPRSSWPRWLRVAGSESLQRCIAAFEAIAQLCLLLLRHDRGHSESGGFMLRFSQLCDNAGVSALSGKMLTASEPLCYVLQAIGFYCCHLGVALHSNHIAGQKNHWADALSRGNIPPGFCSSKRETFDVCKILQRPWLAT